ncbi:amidase [Enterovirga sp. CN4-39]|uniref:amidase n=1 Tax=Enterovirga sp. CN4-39 TaxID=3400910 RepID=UPI003C0E156E
MGFSDEEDRGSDVKKSTGFLCSGTVGRRTSHPGHSLFCWLGQERWCRSWAASTLSSETLSAEYPQTGMVPCMQKPQPCMVAQEAQAMRLDLQRNFVRDAGNVRALVRNIAECTLSPVKLVQRCLDRITEVDAEVCAWVHVAADEALADARRCEEEAQRQALRGPLHGIPFGVKDVIDVAGMPTRCGSRSRADIHQAHADAELVAAARAAGAIVLGKLHTTEFAFFDPAPTHNPHAPAHTPGGSSSGSGAAVASGTVPLALGTQTFASVNRPAAYCGVAAFKPSTRSLSTFGITSLAPYSDTIGFFGQMVEDAVSFFEAVAPPCAMPLSPVTGRMRVAFLDDPLVEQATGEARDACRAMMDALGADLAVETRPAPVRMQGITDLLRTVMLFEMARNHRCVLDEPEGMIGPRFIEGVRDGLAIPTGKYLACRRELDAMRRAFFSALADVDLFLWPAAPGPAPKGLQSTGDPGLIAPWTALGSPILTIPTTTSAAGLPLGCILAGHPGADLALCHAGRRISASWDRKGGSAEA